MTILSVQSVWAMVMILMVLKGTTRWRTAASVVVQEQQLERTGILEGINMTIHNKYGSSHGSQDLGRVSTIEQTGSNRELNQAELVASKQTQDRYIGLIEREHGLSYDDIAEYLTELRDSGTTNMFGAVPFLVREYGLPKRDAQYVLHYWFESFKQ